MAKIIKLEKANVAEKIGAAYRQGREALIGAGKMLIAQKESLSHGEWLPWLKANEEILGFGVRTADRLMKLVVNDQFDIWGNDGRHTNLEGVYEWYTPNPIIEAARKVMGSIDLDPASCEYANRIVQADKYFTEKDNGLVREWRGNVWINPPFAHPTVKHFANKLMESLGAGVRQAVWLSNACVDVVWWHQLAEIGIVCFHKGRIKFYGEDGDLQPPTLGQSIFYFGDNRDKFREIFSKFGVVLS